MRVYLSKSMLLGCTFAGLIVLFACQSAFAARMTLTGGGKFDGIGGTNPPNGTLSALAGRKVDFAFVVDDALSSLSASAIPQVPFGGGDVLLRFDGSDFGASFNVTGGGVPPIFDQHLPLSILWLSKDANGEDGLFDRVRLVSLTSNTLLSGAPLIPNPENMFSGNYTAIDFILPPNTLPTGNLVLDFPTWANAPLVTLSAFDIANGALVGFATTKFNNVGLVPGTQHLAPVPLPMSLSLLVPALGYIGMKRRRQPSADA